MIAFFQTNGTAILAFLGALGMSWAVLAFAFRSAVKGVMEPSLEQVSEKIDGLKTEIATLRSEGKERDGEIALIRQSSTRLESDMGEIKRLLEEIAPRKARR